MWRRLSTPLRTLATATRSSTLNRSAHRPAVAAFYRHFASDSENVVSKKRVEDVMPIATGHEREELEAELEGRKLDDIDHPAGPFGTKEAPAVIKSTYDKRIVGCPGGEGEDEHDVVWFWLEKGKPHECPVCSQYFVLDVIGPGGPPDGHGDDEHH
ncbi:cytochrome c oxidase subunit 5b-1, mitochondrial-like [Rhododendron vialii]|uniref:cytochrome c oxidase subunit 5b-1, mitochondrial-like n=1 Tax=Rhododendron vialii TaxID=182163 RepID=UPI00265EE9A1|nr:cytochrome c oxidase subunit 5b-1, mitochondrial-like [Rhododendron vialii]XP_058226775.1 cytochrome c oxidase subunit 5b-1, mitochondrial-like [Rhododendron vialii]